MQDTKGIKADFSERKAFVKARSGFAAVKSGCDTINLGSITINSDCVGTKSIETKSNFMAGKRDPIEAWLAKYTPVEQEILKARENLLVSRQRRRRERAKRFADLCEATEGKAVTWRRAKTPVADQIALAHGDVFTLLCLARYHRLQAGRALERLRHQVRRPLYYAVENARRRALAEERRKISRRTTENPCPTREAILDAWINRRKSPAAAIRFGSLIEDLECYLDNSLIRNESGGIVGRRGGIKQWLQIEIPALYLRYTTVMRYKAAARKLRQIAGVGDPTPAARIVEESVAQGKMQIVEASAQKAKVAAARNVTHITRNVNAPSEARIVEGAAKNTVPAISPSLLRARELWQEVIEPIRPNPTSLMARLDALLDPECVEAIGRT